MSISVSPSRPKRQNQVMKDSDPYLERFLGPSDTLKAGYLSNRRSPQKPGNVLSSRIEDGPNMDRYFFENDTVVRPRENKAVSKPTVDLFDPSPTNFFNQFKEDVYEIRNRRYSPQKTTRSDLNSPLRPLLPIKRNERTLMSKIQSLNERNEELEAKVRQLLLENQHLKISNESLNELLKAREESLQKVKKNSHTRESQLRLQLESQQELYKTQMAQPRLMNTSLNAPPPPSFVTVKPQPEPQRQIQQSQPESHMPQIPIQHQPQSLSQPQSQSLSQSLSQPQPQSQNEVQFINEIERLDRLENENDMLRNEIYNIKLELAAAVNAKATAILETKTKTHDNMNNADIAHEQQNSIPCYGQESTEELMGPVKTMDFLRIT